MSRRSTLLFESGFWRDAAKCRDTNLDSFFPVGTTGAALDQIAAAKALCQECQVREMCLEFSLATNQDSGVWGGHSEEERRVMRRERSRLRRLEKNHPKEQR